MPLELALQKGCISGVEAMSLPRAPSPAVGTWRGLPSPTPRGPAAVPPTWPPQLQISFSSSFPRAVCSQNYFYF